MHKLLAVFLLSAVTAHAEIAPEGVSDESKTFRAQISTWTMMVITTGESNEYLGGRITFTYKLPKKVMLFSRVDITGSQSTFDFYTPETFRAIEGYFGIGKALGPVIPALVGGITWSVDSEQPHFYSLYGTIRFPLPNNSYIYIGGGIHDAVNANFAIIGTFSLKIGPTRYIAGCILPVSSHRNNWMIRTGIEIPIKFWEF